MKQIVITIIFVCGAFSAHPQAPCWIINDFISLENARSYAEEIGPSPSETDTFQVMDMCTVGKIRLIELRRTRDSLGFEEFVFLEDYIMHIPTTLVIITMDEDIIRGEKISIGNRYLLEVCPYFPNKRLMGDFLYPILIGEEKEVAVEVKMPPHGNLYTSPNIIGLYYISSRGKN